MMQTWVVNGASCAREPENLKTESPPDAAMRCKFVKSAVMDCYRCLLISVPISISGSIGRATNKCKLL